MSALKPGDKAIILPHPSILDDTKFYIGQEVTVEGIAPFDLLRTQLWGTVWHVIASNGQCLQCAEFLLQKIDPDDDSNFESWHTPDKKVSWDSCVWKPKVSVTN